MDSVILKNAMHSKGFVEFCSMFLLSFPWNIHMYVKCACALCTHAYVRNTSYNNCCVSGINSRGIIGIA